MATEIAAESGQIGYRNGCGDPLPGLRPLTATGNKDKLLIQSLEPFGALWQHRSKTTKQLLVGGSHVLTDVSQHASTSHTKMVFCTMRCTATARNVAPFMLEPEYMYVYIYVYIY